MLFFPRDPAKKTCSPNMNLVQTNIPDHANILQMLMWNQWKTLKIPWNFLLLNGCGWTYMILTYVTLLQTHSDSRQTPPGNPACCFKDSISLCFLANAWAKSFKVFQSTFLVSLLEDDQSAETWFFSVAHDFMNSSRDLMGSSTASQTKRLS